MTQTVARIGIVTVSDRASRGDYEDLGGPAIHDWLTRALTSPWEPVVRLIPDERAQVEAVVRAGLGWCRILVHSPPRAQARATFDTTSGSEW